MIELNHNILRKVIAKVFKTSQIALLSCSLIFLIPAAAAEEKNDARADVQEYMTYHLGRWKSNTTYFDADGNVVKTEAEGNGEKTLIEGQVNLHYSYNTDGTVNTAFRFHSPEDDKLYMIDVTHEGRWWVISGNRGENVFNSQEKELPDGRKIILKITHGNIRPGAYEAVAELSFDGGETWQKFSHQDYKKIGENLER